MKYSLARCACISNPLIISNGSMHNDNWGANIKTQYKNSKNGLFSTKVVRYFYFRQISTDIVTISITLLKVLVNDDDGDDEDDHGADDDRRSNLLATVLKHVIPSHAVETVLSLL